MKCSISQEKPTSDDNINQKQTQKSGERVKMFGSSRSGGVRGGQDQFNWDDVKVDKHRENYLGKHTHSIFILNYDHFFSLFQVCSSLFEPI